mmetsp:Transcript_4651/g.13433  ORF Transcript_4651/g.13433 Transcript_4651/m.13433 type:complete len:554 (-) Transcript_4651:1414-3075(-)
MEFANQDRHDKSGVMAGVAFFHQRDHKTDRLEECCKGLAVLFQRTLPQRSDHGVEAFDTIRMGSFGKRCACQRRHDADLLHVIGQTVRDDFDELAKVREDGHAHEQGDLLDDFDACVSGLPRFSGLAHGLQEWQQRRHSQGTGDNRNGSGCDVAHVLVGRIDVRTHGGDHGGQAGCLGEVADDLASLHARVVVLVDQQRFDHGKDSVHVRSHHVVELVEDAIDDLHQEMAFLVFKRRAHQQWKDLVEERSGAKRPGPIRDLAHRGLSLGRRSALDLQQQRHDSALVDLVFRDLLFLDVLHQATKVLHVLWFDVRQRSRLSTLRSRGGEWDAVRLANLLDGGILALFDWDFHLKPLLCCAHGRRGCQELATWGAKREVAFRWSQDGIPLRGKDGIQRSVGPRTITRFHLAFKGIGLGHAACQRAAIGSSSRLPARHKRRGLPSIPWLGCISTAGCGSTGRDQGGGIPFARCRCCGGRQRHGSGRYQRRFVPPGLLLAARGNLLVPFGPRLGRDGCRVRLVVSHYASRGFGSGWRCGVGSSLIPSAFPAWLGRLA